jgi:hypothetical protein
MAKRVLPPSDKFDGPFFEIKQMIYHPKVES